MAKAPKRRVRAGDRTTSGRVTPKGGAPGKPTPSASLRYTPPVPREMKVSPWWVPTIMFSLLVVGTLIIVLNYLALLPDWGFLPDGTSNVWLLVGLLAILVGIIVATQWQ
ncbi:MAG: cell division protein CrgA [Acidimicrobiales bacterium]